MNTSKMAFITLASLLTLMTVCHFTTAATGPLKLTPYLDRNNIGLARTLSRVHSKTIPESYSGYITVNKTLNNHLFFWHFPTTSKLNPRAPLLLWLNGGPSVSSMFGLFVENGPLEMLVTDPPKVTYREKSWTNHYSMLYVDSPVGVGFSYSDSGNKGWRETQEGYGMDLHSFIKQFFKMFPEYKSRGFYVGGQSYAGHYVPVLAHLIHEDLQSGISDVPLTGIYIGGPYFDTGNMMDPFFEYLYSIGTITFADKLKYQASGNAMYNDFLHDPSFNLTMEEVLQVMIPNEIDTLGLSNFVTREQSPYYKLYTMLNHPSWHSLLKVGNVHYLPVRDEIRIRFTRDILTSTSDKLAVILNQYKALIYTGDFDIIVNSRMVDEALMLLTPWSHQQAFRESVRVAWKNAEGNLLGNHVKVGNLCRVVIHGAGHNTPRDKPETTLHMLKRFIDFGCI